MDETRKKRLLDELRNRFRDAAMETRELSDGQWDDLEKTGLEDILLNLKKLPGWSAQYREQKEAVALLHPHREAWKIILPYRREILETDEEEQQSLLDRIVNVLETNSRMNRSDIMKHIYAFWPVPPPHIAARLERA